MGQVAHLGGAIVATAATIAALLRLRWQRHVLGIAMGLLSIASAHLILLLVREDTSYVIVTNHTRPGLDMARRIMGLWGGSAGSLLLFTLVLGWIAYAAPVIPRLRLASSLAVAVLAWASVLAASPFERLDTPAIAGTGLSPILEHWAMLIHPPLLYIGLGLSLIPAVVDAGAVRRWTVAAIGFLTVALALGGGWAYVELGWGGWWAWDPVENAALIPWLLLVASLHVGPTSAPARWSTLLIWPSVFAGAAMTRTSLRTSVHAFANSKELGWALWPLAVVLSVGMVFYGITTIERTRIARHRLLPVAVLMSTALVVAMGTFRPFVPGDGTDGSFYSRFLFPVTIIGLISMGVAPRLRTASPRRLLLEGLAGTAVAGGYSVAVGWTIWWQLLLAIALGIATTMTLLAGVAPRDRILAHLGMILVLAGALGGTASTTQTLPLALDESVVVSGRTIQNHGVEVTQENPPVITATLDVDDVQVRPALTVYAERRLRLPEVATVRSIHEDVQVILRSADDDGSVTITVNVEPLTQLVWIGASLITVAMVMFGLRDQSERFSRRAFSSSDTVAEDAGAATGAGSGAVGADSS